MTHRRAAPARCAICEGKAHEVLYHGPIRVGGFGSYSAEPETVWRCVECGAGRLPVSSVDYETSEYRMLVDTADTVDAFRRTHDGEQPEKLRMLGTSELRDRVVMDVGCGGGAFLDLVRGFARTTIGVEPATSLRRAVREAGHLAFAYCADVPAEWAGRVDVAVAFSIIEHVEDPAALLRDVARLLCPGGRLLISTPNRRDLLLELLPEDYARFFYRLVHLWYFDSASLTTLLHRAGFREVSVRYVHRFDLSNAVLWLRDKRPTGIGGLPTLRDADPVYRSVVESTGRADYLYAYARKA
ncbi:MAG TPA: class I SAM-dependent methyltransferase [Methylomirabilota bacterium]|nr:class I SAM-dependent methyltransferase [Methylomirabilota bacterium]